MGRTDLISNFKYLEVKVVLRALIFACLLSFASTSHADSSTSDSSIQSQWEAAKLAIAAGDLTTANDRIIALEQAMKQEGYLSLDGYASFLVAQGETSLAAGDLNSASFFARKSAQLAPNSPLVILSSLRLTVESGEGQLFKQLFRAIKNLPGHYGVLLMIVTEMAYGLALVLTLGLLGITTMQFGCQTVVLLRRMARRLPPLTRGFLAPILVLSLLCLPLFFGMLWTVFAWAVLIYFLLPEKRWLVFTSASLIALWAVLIPMRENIRLWFDDPGVQAMLKVSSGSYSDWDRDTLVKMVETRGNDPFAAFTLAQLMRRQGEFEKAERYFQNAERVLGRQPWTTAQYGLIAFLRHQYQRAEELFEEARNAGLHTPELLFNQSKTRYQLLDTKGGRELYTEAHRLNPELIDNLQSREAEFGITSGLAVGEISLPLSALLKSALQPISESGPRSDQVSQALMHGLTPPKMAIAAALLFVLFFMMKSEAPKRRIETCYTQYKPAAIVTRLFEVIPGGALVLRGRPIRGFIFLSMFLFLVFPILGWPQDMNVLQRYLWGITLYYSVAVGVLAVAVLYITNARRREVIDA
ncbi:MAG: tetratricopeptide repeat protein [Oligoflexia bacterium]|nr:tetratricopeptide repeat protein [Oligoflexia bacterium]